MPNIRGIEPVVTLRGHTDKVSAVCFSSDGTRVLSGSKDRTLRLWDGRRVSVPEDSKGTAGGRIASR